MIINFKKCQFMRSSVTFLGHVISKEGVKPTDSKTLEIVEFETLRDIKTLKTFLGVSYYRRLIPEFAEQASRCSNDKRSYLTFSHSEIKPKEEKKSRVSFFTKMFFII